MVPTGAYKMVHGAPQGIVSLGATGERSSSEPSQHGVLKSTRQTLELIADAFRDQRYEDALSLAEGCGLQGAEIKNAMGVCQMRLGRYKEAADLFRSIVLLPSGQGCWPNAPQVYKRNFATALLLTGQPERCRTILLDAKDDSPRARELLHAIRSWEESLPFGAKLGWWFDREAPQGRPVKISFLPGELASHVATRAFA